MSLSELLAIGGIVVGLAGLVYAFYQDRERKKLKDYIRSQNWLLFNKVNKAIGSLQAALRMYTEHTGDKNVELVQHLVRADAFGQDVFMDTIRQIQLSEPRFDQDMITLWVKSKRVDETQAQLFRNLAPVKEDEG